MHQSMRIFLTGAIAASGIALAACGDSTNPPDTPDIAGTWQLEATLANTALQATCDAEGTVQITQDGESFTGQISESTLTCTAPAGTITDDVDGPLTGGEISGTSLTYSDGTCDYSGEISGSPPDLVSGNAVCTVTFEGQDVPLSGTWQISR